MFFLKVQSINYGQFNKVNSKPQNVGITFTANMPTKIVDSFVRSESNLLEKALSKLNKSVLS